MEKNDFLKPTSRQDVLGKRPDVRILFLGARNAGKTALIVRFLTKRFIGEYDNTADVTYTKQITINTQEVAIEMLDPRSQESKKNLRGRIDWADAIVLVYSVASRRSFSEASSIMEAIDKATSAKRKPTLLIANKIDLRHRRIVPVSDGQSFAKRWGCSYFECSAAVYSNGYETICEAMVELCQEVLRLNAVKRNAGRLGRRRASLSPRPFRDAIFKMFGTTKDDILTCKQSDL